MMPTLVDSNVVLDIIKQGVNWLTWSLAQIKRCGNHGDISINPIAHPEASAGFSSRRDCNRILESVGFVLEAVPWDAAFDAGHAHAAVKGYTLLTRDARRCRSYFPALDIIAPGSHP